MRYLFILVFITGVILSSSQSLDAQVLYRVDSAITTIYHGGPKADVYVKYKYSNGRGSDVLNRKYDFDTMLVAAVGGKPLNRYYREYNSSDSITVQVYGAYNDTTKQFDLYNDSAVYIYDSQNNLVEKTVMGWRTKMLYDGNNNLVKRLFDQFLSGVWVYSGADTLIYNTSNQLVCRHGLPTATNNNIDSFRYDSNGRLTGQVTYHKMQSGTWWVYQKYQYQYIGGGLQGFLFFDWYDSTGALYVAGKDSFAYDNSGRQIADVWSLLDTMTGQYVDEDMRTYTYNQNGYPIIWRYFLINRSPVGLNEEVLYFYKPYFPAGVSTQQKLSADVRLYPVPAKDILNISVNFKKPQASTTSIYDMNGRLLKQFAEPEKDQLARTMVVDDLPAGMYQLLVSSEEGSASQSFTIVR